MGLAQRRRCGAERLEDEAGNYQPHQERRASPIGQSSNDATHTQGETMQSDYDAHCTRKACHCNHVQCYKGWIDTDKGTTPCQYCRGNTHERWLKREQARHKGYPLEALSRIMTTPVQAYDPRVTSGQ